jgi:hypothetical protein
MARFIRDKGRDAVSVKRKGALGGCRRNSAQQQDDGQCDNSHL